MPPSQTFSFGKFKITVYQADNRIDSSPYIACKLHRTSLNGRNQVREAIPCLLHPALVIGYYLLVLLVKPIGSCILAIGFLPCLIVHCKALDFLWSQVIVIQLTGALILLVIGRHFIGYLVKVI